MSKLVSEQLPNDGGYHVKRLVNEANGRLKQVGKQGKRATIVAKKTSLTLQFTFDDGDGRSQKNVGLGAISLSPKGILEAEKIAEMVTHQLVANTFNWDWFNALIGKNTSKKTQVQTCKEMVEQYKEHFLRQRKDNKAPEKSWYDRCAKFEKVLGNLDKPLSLALIREVIESTDNNSSTRERTIGGLVEFLKYHDNSDYKKVIQEYKKNNNPKPKKRNIPNDQRITEVYQMGFTPSIRCTKGNIHTYSQWQFLYSLLAIYGLRIHEAWNIANWDKPVTLKNGDWVAVEVIEDEEVLQQFEGDDIVIPAILDPNNKDYILCIKHESKTGYRMTMPLSPDGHDWVKEFDLLKPFNIPYVKDALKRNSTGSGGLRCSNRTCEWFRNNKYGFTPHSLRHACNHRGHRLGVNVDVLCQSLGHSFQTNVTTYRNSKSEGAKLQDLKQSVSKQSQKRSRVEDLEIESKVLKAENENLKEKIKLLETELKMYKAIAKSKGQK